MRVFFCLGILENMHLKVGPSKDLAWGFLMPIA